MPPKVRSVVGKLREESRSSCEREQFLRRAVQLGRYWLGQFAHCSVSANFVEVQFICWSNTPNSSGALEKLGLIMRVFRCSFYTEEFFDSP
jgi:hypothetical protein